MVTCALLDIESRELDKRSRETEDPNSRDSIVP